MKKSAILILAIRQSMSASHTILYIYSFHLKLLAFAASAVTKFESTCIAQLIQVELLRRHFIDSNLGRLLAKSESFQVEGVYTEMVSKFGDLAKRRRKFICLERATNHGVPADDTSEGVGAIAVRQGASEDQKFAVKATQQKTKF